MASVILRILAGILPLAALAACAESVATPTATIPATATATVISAVAPIPTVAVTLTPETITCPRYGTVLRSPSAPPPAIATATTVRQIQELDAAEHKWQAAGVNHYRISVGFNRFGPPGPYTVEVQDGMIVNAPVYPGEDVKRFTVPALFATVRRELVNPCMSMNVAYDSTYGYPSYISDIATVQVSDADYSESVVAFMPLP